MDEVRNRYLRDRVMTATPAQRVVMLFDRLILDVNRARESADVIDAGAHIGHATSIVAELMGSLDVEAGGPAENLGQLYGYLIGELTAIRSTGDLTRLAGVAGIVTDLRDAFSTAAATVAGVAATSATAGLLSAGGAGRFAATVPTAAPSANRWVG